MPIYEYECQACGHRQEALQKINDDPLVDCPQCEAPQLKKLVSAAAFRLKGGGWYETDFKKSGKKNILDGEKSADKDKKEGGDKAKSESASDKGAKAADNKPASTAKKVETPSKPSSS